MPPTAFEHTVNEARGYACLLITISSFIIVLIDPRSLLFWRRDGYSLNTASTGMLGIATSSAFLLYLLIDTLVGIACSHKFRRPMTAVYVHHVIVGIGTAAFLLPGAPPRGFFLYVWGEALTAVRVLPSGPRHDARSFVFAGRRALWIYLLLRDVYFFQWTHALYGAFAASVPPLVALLLLVLDWHWWKEHARSGEGHKTRRRESDGEALLSTPGGNTTPPADEEQAGAVNGNGGPAPPRSLNLEAARSESYDDLCVHTP